jgi:L-iditol 2-dehydrogenase
MTQRIHAAAIGAETIRTERIGVERMSVEKISAERISTEKISVGKIGAEKISARPIISQSNNAQPTIPVAAPAIPKLMRAAVYRGVNDVRVETVPVPVDADGRIGAGDVLVRIDSCGICGTDLKKIHSGSHSAPRIFGHEMAGTISMVGEDVTHFAIGDRVMAYHHIPCGECYYCRKQTFAQCETYKKVGCTAGFAAAGGGFAEYIRVADWIVGRPGKTAGLIRIPDDIPFEQASFIEPTNTCYKAVRLLNLQTDETVLVIGQGPIGIMLAALAKRTGATVLTSDLYAERHAVAAKFGLDRPLDARGDVVAAAKAATKGRGADVALVAVGADALIRVAMDAVRPGGRVMLFAATQHGEAEFDPAAVCMDEKTLMGSYSASVAINDAVAELVFAGYRDGSFDLTRLISHRFPLERAAEAIELASNPRADSMKIVIQPCQP